MQEILRLAAVAYAVSLLPMAVFACALIFRSRNRHQANALCTLTFWSAGIALWVVLFVIAAAMIDGWRQSEASSSGCSAGGRADTCMAAPQALDTWDRAWTILQILVVTDAGLVLGAGNLRPDPAPPAESVSKRGPYSPAVPK